ncbi:citrate lyase holo-[acyl-carrier protein] synthase [Silvimonas soli]|uniref:citrate lyase holo-[acyl-carrier protein] synthase n=1 Tax=Silvimonas soli TaxID=2980100 RepID=UPI0024B39E38|nr:citrate lyase holo-[acyl-carrier protein] synthase [Silvimonas soli]
MTTSSNAVDLAQVLAARDARVQRQAALRARFGWPLISLTLVSPGANKNGPLQRYVMQQALATLDECLQQTQWAVLVRETIWPVTGPEAFFVVQTEAEPLKRLLIDLESRHPLGRLWDMDVIGPAGPLSRRALQLPVRRCLVCGEPAHACARARTHPLSELLTAIEEQVHAFERSHATACHRDSK